MVKIEIITLGAMSEPYYRDACNEYKKRLSTVAAVNETEIKEVKLSHEPSKAEIEKALEAEADKIIAKIPPRAFVIPLCIEGKQFSSEELAEKIEGAQIEGKSCICFIIGSSYGLSDRVKKLGDLKLSMSRLTFPHKLARVMLYETVYRSFSIISGSKYHK